MMRIFADLRSRLIRRWDLDGVQLAALASARRGGTGRSRPRTRAPSSILQFVLFFIFGLTGVAGVLAPSFFLGLVFSHTLIMLMLALPLLNHCATVLLDTSENRMLLHLPISGRTLLASRLLGIAGYAGVLALSISLPTAIAIAIRFGAVALLVFAITCILSLVFIVSAVLANCLIVLRHVHPVRIRQGILWLQTALVVVIVYAGAMVLNADVPLVKMMPELSESAGWYLYPPAWMAGLLDYSLMERTPFNGILAVTAVLAPLAVFVGCMVSFAGGRFTALLSRLEVVPGAGNATSGSARKMFARLAARLSLLMNRDRQQRAIFDLASKLMGREAALKRRIYSFTGVVLLNTVIIVTKFGDRAIQNRQLFTLCYLPLFLAATGPLVQYGVEWRAAWCYQVLPFDRSGTLVSGVLKAYLCRYIFPVCTFLLVVSGVVWGAAAALDAAYAFAAVTLVCVLQFWNAAPALPFSRDPTLMVTRSSGKARKWGFIPLAIAAIVIHVVLESVAGEWGVVGGVMALTIAILAIFRNLRVGGVPERKAPDQHLALEHPPA